MRALGALAAEYWRAAFAMLRVSRAAEFPNDCPAQADQRLVILFGLGRRQRAHARPESRREL